MSSLKLPGQISFFGGGGYSTVVKTQSAKSWPNFNFFWGGGEGHSGPRIGQTGIFEHKFIPLGLAFASQIVSHILRMWRLIRCSVLSVPVLCLTERNEKLSVCSQSMSALHLMNISLLWQQSVCASERLLFFHSNL